MNSHPVPVRCRMPIWKFSQSILWLLIIIGTPLTIVAQTQNDQDPDDSPVDEVDFSTQVLPILSNHCFACHGPDSQHREAGLRLDVEADAKDYAVVAGMAADSPLWQRVTSDDPDLRMPPVESDKALTADQIQILQRWIDQGAHWSQHWSFVSPELPAVPESNDQGWARQPIDHFVLARMKAHGLTPAHEATRAEWLRRVSFDLTGLPPTLEQLASFESDSSATAYQKQVDRLMATPQYGERMAADWLDLARFADTNGYQNDFNRSMWPWRDWVINAFQEHMPIDQFITEQVAGDLLPNPSTDQLVATGFNRNHRTVTEGGSIDEEWRVENVVDRAETTSIAFLGLTMGCARCHDHKYDPISQENFYQFYAFFNNVDEQGVYTERRGNVPPMVSIPNPTQEARLAELQSQKSQLEQSLQNISPNVEQFLTSLDATAAQVRKPAIRLVRDFQLQPAPTNLPDSQVRYAAGEAVWTAGPAGLGVDLDGSELSHIVAGQAWQVHADQPASWAMWARVDRPGAILSKMDDAAGYRGFDTIVLEDFRLKVHLIDHWPDNALAITTRNPIPEETWFHLAVTYDGSRSANGIKVHVDGQPVPLKTEQDSLTGTLSTEQPLRLGRRSTSLFLNGAIADVQGFDEALSTDSLQRILGQALRDQESPRSQEVPSQLQQYVRRRQSSSLQSQIDAISAEQKSLNDSIPTCMVMRDRPEYRATHLLKRGQYDAPDTTRDLWPQLPDFLGTLSDDLPPNRLGLAQWMVSDSNPLTTRVWVNRIWHRLLGRGLVPTVDNFGRQGDPPSHPELLDWLAVQFRESGWDHQAIQRMIVLSATYRQSANVPDAKWQQDPENRWLARGPRQRLTAEMIRDNALALAGLLSDSVGGPSVKPYQPEGLWDELAGGANGGPYQLSPGEDLYRRSLYTFRKRTVSHPTLSTFDAPSWEICTAKRATTNTPLQALALLNDTTYVEAARHLALRMQNHSDQLAEQLNWGFQLATQRLANKDEQETLIAAYEKYRSYYQSHPELAKQYLEHGASSIPEAERTVELAALATTAAVILNLDETITK